MTGIRNLDVFIARSEIPSPFISFVTFLSFLVSYLSLFCMEFNSEPIFQKKEIRNERLDRKERKILAKNHHHILKIDLFY